MLIFHVATRADWDAARASGAYTTSTYGVSLAQEGFLHASREDQWPGVLERYYAHVREPLVLLTVDTELLDVPSSRSRPRRASRRPSRTCTARSTRPPSWRCDRSAGEQEPSRGRAGAGAQGQGFFAPLPGVPAHVASRCSSWRHHLRVAGPGRRAAYCGASRLRSMRGSS